MVKNRNERAYLRTPGGWPEVASIGPRDVTWVRLRDEDADDRILHNARQVGAHRGVLLTIDGGPTHHLTHERLVKIFSVATELATSTAVALLVTGADPVTVEAGLDALHFPPPGAPDPLGDPFLVIDGTGNARWCGGPPDERAVLDGLLHEPLSIAEDARALPLQRLYPHLVRGDDGTVGLRVSASTVVEHLAQLTADLVEAALNREGPGVRVGVFRTPNLHLTTRWVNVDRLLDDTVGAGVAAFLSAQRLTARLPGSLHGDTHLVQIDAEARTLARMLAESARLRRPVHEMTGENEPAGSADRLPAGSRVILCADIVLTENRVTHCLRELIEWGAVPLAIVAPLDARDHNGPVVLDDLEVPLISLAKVSSSVGDVAGEDIVDIDPVLRVPVAETSRPDKQYRWSPEEFLRACAELPSVVGLGHVQRPAGRHFTAYLDASRIIDSGSRLRDQIANEVTTLVQEWLLQGADAAGDAGLTICHAGSRDGYARRLSELFASRLRSQHIVARSPSLIQVPRAVVGSRYAFPDSVDLPPDGDVILVDWGSFDATTLLQLVRLAAEAGARRILTIVLLSQLTEHEERILTMMSAVAATERDARPADIRIRFLTAIGITPVGHADCSLCELAATLRTEARYRIAPREVAAHAITVADSLRTLNRDAIARRGGLDAFGARAATEDAIEYVRLRGMVLLAQRSTSEAARLRDHIVSIADRSHDQRAHAAIRLLAAEQHWLRLSPIRLKQCLPHVVRLAATVALDHHLDERLRLQAVIVLAKASPSELVHRLHVIWRSALPCDELLLHLLYQLWSMILPGSRANRRPPAELRQQVRQCLAIGSAAYLSPERAEDMQYLLTRLLQAMDFGQVDRLDLTAQDAWAGLRAHYLFALSQHSDAETAAVNLMVLMEELPLDPGPLKDELWRTISSGWKDMATFVKNNVLPFTVSMMDIFGGAFAHEHLTATQRLRLQGLASISAARELASVDSQIHELRGGDRDSADFALAWREVRQKVYDWHRSVLAAGGTQERQADLAEFLEPCPADVLGVLTEAIDLSRRKREPVRIEVQPHGRASLEVFCHRDLLRSTVQQIIHNAIKPSHRQPDFVDKTVDLLVDVEVGDTMARIRFRNTGTTPTVAAGKGIISLRRKLHDFAATLTPVEPAEGWSYEIELVLELWASASTGESQ